MNLHSLLVSKTLSKLIGKTVLVRPIGYKPAPEHDPDKSRLIYVPLPDYGIGLWYYTEAKETQCPLPSPKS